MQEFCLLLLAQGLMCVRTHNLRWQHCTGAAPLSLLVRACSCPAGRELSGILRLPMAGLQSVLVLDNDEAVDEINSITPQLCTAIGMLMSDCFLDRMPASCFA